MKVKNSITKLLIKTEKSNRISQLLVLFSFFITFVFIRGVTHLQKAGLLPNQSGVFHLHHLVPGIFSLLISGYVSISFWSNRKLRYSMAVLFGIGASLTIDEFALWFFLKDVYWAKQGRDSIDGVIIILTSFSLIFLVSTIHDHYYIKKLLGKTKK